MSDDVFDRLKQLSDTIHGASSETTPDDFWRHVEAIDLHLMSDPRFSDQERRLVAQLRSAVSYIIHALGGDKNPDAGSALVAISALESSLQARHARSTHSEL